MHLLNLLVSVSPLRCLIIIHVWGFKNSSVAGAHPLLLSGRNSDFNPRDLYQKFDLGSNVLLICFLLHSRV